MAYWSDCPACVLSNHAGHREHWGKRPKGIIDADMCGCTGDCAERNKAAFDEWFNAAIPVESVRAFIEGECAPKPGCGCMCHGPGGLAVSHVAPCCCPPIRDAWQSHNATETGIEAPCRVCGSSGDSCTADSMCCYDCPHDLIGEYLAGKHGKPHPEAEAILRSIRGITKENEA